MKSLYFLRSQINLRCSVSEGITDQLVVPSISLLLCFEYLFCLPGNTLLLKQRRREFEVIDNREKNPYVVMITLH